MSDRKLQFDSSNLSYEDAAAIAEREIKENSPFNVDEILKGQRNKTAFTSSNNSVSVAQIGNTIVVDLNGTEDVMDAIENALNEASSGGEPARTGTSPQSEELGGTGPDDMEFDEANPPSLSQPGEDIEEEKDYYVVLDSELNTRVTQADEGEEPLTAREEATQGPYESRSTASRAQTTVDNAIQNRNATRLRELFEQRFWVHANDDEVLVEVMTEDGQRGKATMPKGLAEEAEMFGWTAVVQDMVPDERGLPPGRQPNYVEPRYYEGWEEIFQYLQEYTADEPEVPSPMDDERVPQSQADSETRMEMARRGEPQATANIYENGVVSLNRDGSVDTLDTALGIFIERDTNDVAMGYMGEDINLSPGEIDEIVENTRQFLEENNG